MIKISNIWFLEKGLTYLFKPLYSKDNVFACLATLLRYSTCISFSYYCCLCFSSPEEESYLSHQWGQDLAESLLIIPKAGVYPQGASSGQIEELMPFSLDYLEEPQVKSLGNSRSNPQGAQE